MARFDPPETGTLVIAGLLLLALAFAGKWIYDYSGGAGAPWSVLPWFGIAAAVIIVVGLLSFLVRGTAGDR